MRLVLIEFAIFQSPQNVCASSAGHVLHSNNSVFGSSVYFYLDIIIPSTLTAIIKWLFIVIRFADWFLPLCPIDGWLFPCWWRLITTLHDRTREGVREKHGSSKKKTVNIISAPMQNTQVCSVFTVRKTRSRFYIYKKKRRQKSIEPIEGCWCVTK